jgi:hypothetical protein
MGKLFSIFCWYPYPALTALCTELYKQMVKALLKYLLYCRVLTFQCLALSFNSGWCQVKKVGDLHQLCIGKFTGWCCPWNNPALIQGQQDTSWMERPGNWPNRGPVLIRWHFVGTWTAALLYTLRPYDLIFNDLLGLRSSERNSSSPNKFKQKAGYNTCHPRVNNLMILSAILKRWKLPSTFWMSSFLRNDVG